MGKPKKKVSPRISSSFNRNIGELAIREIVKAAKDADPCWEIKDKREATHIILSLLLCVVFLWL